MNFSVAPDLTQKLLLLQEATGSDTIRDAMRFEPAGGSPQQEALPPEASAAPQTSEDLARKQRNLKALPCVSHVATPTGAKPVLKSMMTTACERDCFYCPFRAGRSKTKRVTFSPDEMATTFDSMQRAGHVDGLFLSSGIIKGSVTTQDKIIETAEIIRNQHGYRGYVHLKIMPSAEREQIRRAMQLADRVSINLEGPTEQRLNALAPKKFFWEEMVQRLQWASELRQNEGLRASVVTQFVVGAVGDTDLELLSLGEKLYTQLGLKRTYFSAFHPISQTPFEEIAPTPLQRQHRLYQASFLLRDYGWSVEEMPFLADTNLRLDIDPKRAWAEEHLRNAPVEINRAARGDLLRIPGIGPKTADALLAARQRGVISEIAHLKRLGLRTPEQALPYLLLNGRQVEQQLSLF